MHNCWTNIFFKYWTGLRFYRSFQLQCRLINLLFKLVWDPTSFQCDPLPLVEDVLMVHQGWK